MDKVTITPPDQRVNLGTGAVTDDDTISVAVKVTLTAAEAQLIAGAADDRQEACNRFVTDWVSPSLRALGVWLGHQATRDDCRRNCDVGLPGLPPADRTVKR